MALKQAPQVAANKSAYLTPDDASCLVPVSGTYVVSATNPAAIGDIIEMVALPEECVVVDTVLAFDAVASATLDVGVLSGAYGKADNARTMGNEFNAAQSIAAAGMARAAKPAHAVTPGTAVRGLGVKVAGAALTNGTKVTLTAYIRQQYIGA